MAIVVKSDGPKVSASPISNIQQGQTINAESFGARGARQIQRAGEELVDYGSELQKQADLDAITKAETDLNRFEFDVAHDPEKGYFNKKGGNAIGGSKKIVDDYSRFGSDIYNGLKTNSQRDAFDRLMTRRMDTFSRSVARHETTQKNVYSSALNAAAIETAKLNAISDPLNEDYVTQAERRILGYHNANINGLPAEAVSLAKRKDLSELHFGRIQRAIDTNPVQARSILEANKDKFLPADYTRAKKMVVVGTLDNDAMLRSDDIVLNHESYADQLAEARKIKDAKLRDEVLNRIDRRYAQDQRSKAAANESAAEQALEEINSGKSFDELPVKLRLALPDNDSKILRNYSDEKAGIRQSNPIARLEKYDEIMSVYEKDPQNLAKYSLAELHANLDGANLEKVLKARRGGGQSTIKAAERHFGQFVDLAIEDNIVPKADKALFRKKLEEEISGIKDYTYDDIQNAYDRLTSKIVFDPPWWGSLNQKNIYGYKLTGEEDPASIIVPETEENKIIEAFERNGFDLSDITDDMIKRAYAKKTGLKINE